MQTKDNAEGWEPSGSLSGHTSICQGISLPSISRLYFSSFFLQIDLNRTPSSFVFGQYTKKVKYYALLIHEFIYRSSDHEAVLCYTKVIRIQKKKVYERIISHFRWKSYDCFLFVAENVGVFSTFTWKLIFFFSSKELKTLKSIYYSCTDIYY